MDILLPRLMSKRKTLVLTVICTALTWLFAANIDSWNATFLVPGIFALYYGVILYTKVRRDMNLATQSQMPATEEAPASTTLNQPRNRLYVPTHGPNDHRL